VISVEVGTYDPSFFPNLFEAESVSTGTAVAAPGAHIRAGHFRLMEAVETPTIIELIIQEAPGGLTKAGIAALASWFWVKVRDVGRVWINGRTINSEEDVMEVLQSAHGQVEE